MLVNTFIHISGVGAKKEQFLWENGILCWNDLDCVDSVEGVSNKLFHKIRKETELSREKLTERDIDYFAKNMKPGEHWRLFSEFRETTAFLDIETTGLEPGYDTITTIVVYGGGVVKHYVSGRNLDEFVDDIAKYDLLVTYNGKVFDVPFIESEMGISLSHVHIDLRWFLAGLGYKGGQKKCEQDLGLCRYELSGVDGSFAPILWEKYKQGGSLSERALETLLAYNMADVLNLEKLLIIGYNERIDATPFKESKLLQPAQPSIPFSVDLSVLKEVERAFVRWGM